MNYITFLFSGISYDINIPPFVTCFENYIEPIPTILYSFAKIKGTYTSKTGEKFSFYNSWFGSIFTYQFSHAFIDFSKIEDFSMFEQTDPAHNNSEL